MIISATWGLQRRERSTDNAGDRMPATIRLASRDDAAAVAAIYAPFCDSTPISFEIAAPTAEQIASRILAITAQYPWLVLEDAGDIAGYAYASRHRERAAYGWSVDVSAYVHPAHHRRGVARALYTALFDLLRRQGYFKAFAGITLPNPASTGLHEAMGFRLIGVCEGVGYKHGRWHDVAWYQMPLQPERSDPAAPLAVSALAGTREWTVIIRSVCL
jgi:L-amino acid N-acyltransferase YncA